MGIPYWNVPYDMHNLATFSNLVTIQTEFKWSYVLCQLEQFIIFLLKRWKHLLYVVHKCCMDTEKSLSCTFFYLSYYENWHFPPDDQWISIILLLSKFFVSSTMRWAWNTPSFHICLDYRMENTENGQNFKYRITLIHVGKFITLIEIILLI